MTLLEMDANTVRELSSIELDTVVGGGGPGRGYGWVYDVPPPPRVVNAPQRGGGGPTNLPHLHAF